jgi:hypothetical protein
MSKKKKVGILTAGGDCPGLNAAIRGFGKAAINEFGMELIGFQDGVRGLAENRYINLDGRALSGILTIGGTILGTSRDKVNRMVVDGQTVDMVPTIVENYEKLGLDALVTLGGGGTARNAYKLSKAGLNVVHLRRPSTTTSSAPTTPSASRPPWRSPPTPLTGCTPPPTPITGSSWPRSWATGRDGWPWDPASPAAPTSSCCPSCPITSTRSSTPSSTAASRG